jgi:hypothetical protein
MQDHKIKIAGRSGCKVELYKINRKEIIRKSSALESYNQRLSAQCVKQKQFNDLAEYFLPFTAPLVYTHADVRESGLFWFEMEFIPGEKYSEYLERCTLEQLDSLVDHYIGFIQKEFRLAQIAQLDNRILTGKLDDLKSGLVSKGNPPGLFLEVIQHLREHIPDSPLPLGICHGDFTLSNTLYFSDKIYMIDFLDSFIESPVLDLVKLRQDTKFYWSLLVDTDTQNFQRNKIIQMLRYFDSRLTAAFGRNPYYSTWYRYLEKLNLLRILPYLDNPQEIHFIENCLSRKDV